jgi:5'-deoxynucleotidase YfbR-like HD superfamily hydrolase
MDSHERRVLMTALREAGKIRRCHVHEYHGNYTVGQHSYNAATMLLALYPAPGPSANLLAAMLTHDAQERWVGDLPAPATWYHEALGEAYRAAEDKAREVWNIPTYELTEEEQRWLSAIDKFELWIWCHDQRALGNKNMTWISQELVHWFNKDKDNWPSEVWHAFMNYRWQKLPEYKK